jgi:hypothetical protein
MVAVVDPDILIIHRVLANLLVRAAAVLSVIGMPARVLAVKAAGADAVLMVLGM